MPPVPPIGEVVHAIGDKVRREAERLQDLYRRQRRARMLRLGLMLVGAYLLIHSDGS